MIGFIALAAIFGGMLWISWRQPDRTWSDEINDPRDHSKDWGG